MKKKNLIWGVALLTLTLLLTSLVAACQPATPTETTETPQCSDCHNDTTLVYSKSIQSTLTLHQMGRGWFYAGGRSSCTACHSSEGFQEMVATGKGIEDFETATPNPSPPNCRTCHDIHNTYTSADWALKTTAPVTLLASGETFDRGDGNLCANCHQPRREMAVADGMVNVSSTHWGPHHGPQATMLLGIGGALASGNPSAHYSMINDGCPVCHLANDNHTLKPSITACETCHAGAENFDIGGLQTEVATLLAELEDLLIDEGMLTVAEHGEEHVVVTLDDYGRVVPETHAPHPVVGEYPEAKAGALWNYILIMNEDESTGVHNPTYTKALLEASIEALK
jgi:hypothetical protein